MAAGLAVAALLAGCGGGGSGADGAVALRAESAPVVQAVDLQAQLAAAVPTNTPFNNGTPDPGLLMLLVPDGTLTEDPRVTGWQDAAIELGTRIAPISDSQFLTLGANASKYAGLVLPDQLHFIASDAVIAAVRSYATGGGKVLLTFDFGALTTNANGVPVYPIPKSRLSDLAGVDYVLYDELRDRTTGLGPVTATRSVLRQLQVPPGKSMPYPGGNGAAAALMADASPSVSGATAANGSARFLPPSIQDPGGVRKFDPQQFQTIPVPNVNARSMGQLRRQQPIDYGRSIVAPAVPNVTRASPRSAAAAEAALAGDPRQTLQSAAAPVVEPVDAYSGYLIGHLIYPTYVTRGEYTGVTLATSPQFGLVAGAKPFGAGQVLFVNLPLTYLKGRTDALPMHGFLAYFVHQMLRQAHVSPMPNGIAGLTYNWHFDAMAAQTPSLQLEQMGFFKADSPTSIHMTAGPDAVRPGDGRGWNLNNNPTAKDLLRRLEAAGQDIGNHGGWIHDWYGGRANETNQAEFEPYLELNRQAVDGLLGRASRTYSAPEGNNPTWAMNWLEARGITSVYFLGHTGLGPTRQYRDDVLRNPNLFVFPVTPQGLYATYEEWQFFNVPKAEVMAWHHDLVDFAIQNNTSRLIYAHPPGAVPWVDVLQDLYTYAAAKGRPSFRWYDMKALGNHMTRRQRIVWRELILSNGVHQFDASHPGNLNAMTWRLPKLRYGKPIVITGTANVVDSGNVWSVRVTGGTLLMFIAPPA